MRKKKTLYHFMFTNLDGERRHSLVLNDRNTSEFEILASALPYTNGACDYADQLFLQIPGPLALVFHNLDCSSFCVLAEK